MEYGIYDALRAGFNKVVFIIKPDMEDLMDRLCGDYLRNKTALDGNPVEVEYVFQDFSSVPPFYTIPAERTKPFGTVHALLCAADVVKEPFCVINADDYYGPEAFEKLAAFLAQQQDDGLLHIAMAGYRLDNTLSESGHVSRGVCAVNADGSLSAITERTRIERRDGTPAYTEDDGQTWVTLPPDTVVSMNCWGFPAGALDTFDAYFRAFLQARGGELKSEFYLPSVVDCLMREGKAAVQVLHTNDKWYGMTYAEDRAAVQAAIADMTAAGQYPEGLWK
jgi:dTDP-glucose pyrophosphorylase